MSRKELFARRRDGESNGQHKDFESISMDGYMAREETTLLNSHREIDNMLSHGADILGSLRDQRTKLKGARTRILDITNTLGLSNTVMGLIERRSSKDKIILFAGMIIFTIFMFLAWKYLL